MGSTATREIASQQRRAFWLKHLHQWHWVSSATCLIGMLLFAITGITLNHAAQIEAAPQVHSRQAILPAALLERIAPLAASQHKAPLPQYLRDWIATALHVDVSTAEAEWSPDEVYVSLPRPGGDAWLSIDTATGEAQYELTERGWISYFNDLHKGRNTGATWSWFIDIFAAGCMVFCATGLVLLQLHAANRPATWPMVGLGLIAPLLLALLFIH